MKSTILYFFALFLCTLTVSAQKFEWARQYGFNSTASGLAVVTDGNGNIYLTGSFSGICDFDPGPGTFTASSNGSGDIFVAKLDPTGGLIWAKTMGGVQADMGRAIQVDAAGNVYVAGAFRSTVDFDPGPGTHTLQSPVNQSIYDLDGFILTLSPTGSFIAVHQITGERDEFIDGMVLSNNSLYICGVFGGVTDFDPALTTYTLMGNQTSQGFAARYSLTGNISWARHIDAYSRATALALDVMGDVYVTGWTMGTTNFDPSGTSFSLTSAGGDDIFAWKLSSSGGFIWAALLGGAYSDEGSDITVSNAGNVYLTGFFQDIADFNPGSQTYTLEATPTSVSWQKEPDIFVVNLSSSGQFVWAKSMGSIGYDIGSRVRTDQSGDVYLGGVFQYTVDFDPSYLDAKIASNGSMYDVFINKMDASGNFKWLGQISGPDLEELNAMYINPSSEVFVSGYFKSTSDLDPTKGTAPFTAQGTTDAYLVKMSEIIPTSLGNNQQNEFGVYPVPAKGYLNIDADNCTFTICDLLGKQMMQGELKGRGTVDVTELAAGVYLLGINSGGIRQVKRIIIE